MSAKDLINWGELSRLLSGSRMNVRKNRIPEKYKEQVTSLVNCIESWQTKIQTANAEAGEEKIKTTCRMLINCTVPAINYSTCCGGEANVLMRHNVLRVYVRWRLEALTFQLRRKFDRSTNVE